MWILYKNSTIDEKHCPMLVRKKYIWDYLNNILKFSAFYIYVGTRQIFRQCRESIRIRSQTKLSTCMTYMVMKRQSLKISCYRPFTCKSKRWEVIRYLYLSHYCVEEINFQTVAHLSNPFVSEILKSAISEVSWAVYILIYLQNKYLW